MKISNASMKLLYKLVEFPLMNNTTVDSVVGNKAVEAVNELLHAQLIEVQSGSNLICLTNLGLEFYESKLPRQSTKMESSDYPNISKLQFPSGTLGSFLKK